MSEAPQNTLSTLDVGDHTYHYYSLDKAPKRLATLRACP